MEFLNKVKNYFLTLKDVGIYRISLRIIFEFKIKFYELIPSYFLNYFLNSNQKNINWININNLDLKKNKNVRIYKLNSKKKEIIFNFLNQKKKLSFPLDWNNKSWSKLWRFNLHYFEWARQILDRDLNKKNFNKKIVLIDYLIDEWIAKNSFPKGDGWHSYTLSYRIRNWILIFRYFPELDNKFRVKSLWSQTCWLHKNLELHHGGNHLIENLIALIISSLNFNNKYALKIFKSNLKLLQIELEKQVLFDGGHYERSASYHLILLDHLTEMACLIQIIKRSRPEWLRKIIYKMTNWTVKIKLNKSNMPRFNDFSISSAPNVDEVINFANSYINQCNFGCKSLRMKIVEDILKVKINEEKLELNFDNDQISTLSDTGWTIIRSRFNWELLFKCGIPCPKNIGAHAHSDLLSFEIYCNGKPFINEIGTSTYDKCHKRLLERSSSAHNSLQLKSDDTYSRIKSFWIEPVGVWDNFRVAKKSLPDSRFQGNYKEWLWVNGGHDGFWEINANHQRWIALKISKNKSMICIIIDTVFSKDDIKWRRWFHISKKAANYQWSFWPLESKCKIKNNASYFAKDFNDTFKRPLLKSSGRFKPGFNRLITVISSNKDLIDFAGASREEGFIKIKNDSEIHWHKESIPYFKN